MENETGNPHSPYSNGNWVVQDTDGNYMRLNGTYTPNITEAQRFDNKAEAFEAREYDDDKAVRIASGTRKSVKALRTQYSKKAVPPTTGTKNINDDVEEIVRRYPQWSPAELRRIDEIVEEVLTHPRSGSGNSFTSRFCDRYVTPELRKVRPGAFA